MFCRLLFVLFLSAIAFSVHRFTDSVLLLFFLLAMVLSVSSIYGFWPFILFSFGHGIVCPSIYGFCPFALFSFGHGIFCPSIYGFCPFVLFFWPWYCLSINVRLLSLCFLFLAMVLSVHRLTASDYPFSIFYLFLVHINIQFMPFGLLAYLFLFTMNGLGEGYSRNTSCAMNYIYIRFHLNSFFSNTEI